jgi:hypothetical protein
MTVPAIERARIIAPNRSALLGREAQPSRLCVRTGPIRCKYRLTSFANIA